MALTLTPRRSGTETRAAIVDAAAEAFRDDGYDVATLEEIASRLGITRAAILHHFGSKQEVLAEIVTPFIRELDDLVDGFVPDGRLGPRQQRALLTMLVDLVCKHRPVAALLSANLAAHRHLPDDLQIVDRTIQFGTLLVSDDVPLERATIAAFSAVGAIMRPVAAPEHLVDLDSPANREIVVESALGALRAGLRAARS